MPRPLLRALLLAALVAAALAALLDGTGARARRGPPAVAPAAAVPEQASLELTLSGLALLALANRRRRLAARTPEARPDYSSPRSFAANRS